MTDWHAIRAEYVAGGISQRKLAVKHGIPYSSLQKRCVRENWTASREAAKVKVEAKVLQKTADNAALSKQIQRKLLIRLDQVIDAYPSNSTEYRETKNGTVYVWKFTDITRAYRDLTDNSTMGIESSPLLQALYDLERHRTNEQ